MQTTQPRYGSMLVKAWCKGLTLTQLDTLRHSKNTLNKNFPLTSFTRL